MRLVLQTANVVSDAKNCLYPNRVEAGERGGTAGSHQEGSCVR